MKKKIVQKIIAASIAIATISSTPGLASAVKTSKTPWVESQKKQNQKKKNQRKINRKKKKKKTPAERAVEQEERDRKKVEKMFEKLRKAREKNEKEAQLNQNLTQALKEDNVSETINIQNEVEISEETENILTEMEILERCCKDVSARGNVANAIYELAINGFFKNKSKAEVLKAIDMLKLCVEDDSLKPVAARAIDQLAYCGFFIGWSTKETLKIFEVLTKCAEHQDALSAVGSSIRNINLNVCFKNWQGKDFKELLLSPLKFSQDFNAAQFVSKAISSVLPTVNVRNKKSNNMPQQVANPSLNQNVNVQKNQNLPQQVANLNFNQNNNMQKSQNLPQQVVNLNFNPNNNMQKNQNLPQQVANPNLNQDNNMQKSQNLPQQVANSNLNQDNNMQKNQNLPQQVDDDIDFDKTLDKNFDIVKYILEMSKKDGVFWFLRKNHKKMAKLLFEQLKSKDPRQQIETITQLAKNNCFETWSKTSLLKMFELLKKFTIYDGLKVAVSRAVLALNETEFNSIQPVTRNEMHVKLLDMLLACDENSCDKINILSCLANLILGSSIYDNCSILTQEHKVKILNLLKAGFEDQNSKKSAAYALAAICDKKIYKSFDNELLKELSKIKGEVFNFIKTTTQSSDHFNGRNFAFVITALIVNNFLTSEEIIQNIEILEKCLKNSPEDENVLKSINHLLKHEDSLRLSKEAAFKIIAMLEQYNSGVQYSELFVEVISKLAESLDFKNITKEETLKILCLLEQSDLKSEYNAFLASKMLIHLIDEKFFELLSTQNLPNVTEFLFKLNSQSIVVHLARIIREPEMKQYSNQEMLSKIMLLLSMCSKQKDSEIGVAGIALKLIQTYYDKNTTKEQIVALIEILKQCQKRFWARKFVVPAFLQLIEGGYLKGLSKEEGSSKLTDILQYYSPNPEANIKTNTEINNGILRLAVKLVSEGFLEEYSPDERNKVFSVFEKASDSEIWSVIQSFKTISKENIEKMMDYIKIAKNH